MYSVGAGGILENPLDFFGNRILRKHHACGIYCEYKQEWDWKIPWTFVGGIKSDFAVGR